MEQGKESDTASTRLDNVQDSIASFEPSTESEKMFFSGAVSNFDLVVSARRDRIDTAKEHIPAPLLVLLFAGALVFLATMLPFSASRDSLLLALILLMAALTGAGLFATVVLDYPFSGVAAISPAEFHDEVLRRLARQ